MKYGSRYLYSTPEEIEKVKLLLTFINLDQLTVIPEEWVKKMEEKARLAALKAKQEAEENGSRPSSKQKKKPKKKPVKKGKKGKKGQDEEEKEEIYPIVNLDYACFRTNSMPTLTAFHDFYKLCREKVLLFLLCIKFVLVM